MRNKNMALAAALLTAAIATPMPSAAISAPRADANAQIKAEFDKLGTAFEEFKKTNDEALKAKADDTLIQEKLEKLQASMSDAEEKMKDLAIKAASAAGSSGREIPDAEYTDAFKAHMKRGNVEANLNKGTASEGGYLAPVEWDRTITDKLIEVSPVRGLANVVTIGGAGYKKLANLRGTASGWVGETTARPETNTATFGEQTITTGELYANPAATQQMLDDAEVNLEAWLAGEVETEFSFQEGLAFIAGDGSNKPKGFLTYATGAANAGDCPLGAVEVTTATATTAIASDEIYDLIYSLPTAFTQGAGFVMNRTTLKTIRKLKDGDGNYLWQPSYQAGEPSQIAGYSVTELAGMPDIAAGAIPIAFGDFRRGYTIVDRIGTRVLRDAYTNKPYVHFYTTKRVGGAVTNSEVLKFFKMAAA